jgi:hypothetical protein
MPHSLIALEIGTHSPWISRLLSELGHDCGSAESRRRGAKPGDREATGPDQRSAGFFQKILKVGRPARPAHLEDFHSRHLRRCDI